MPRKTRRFSFKDYNREAKVVLKWGTKAKNKGAERTIAALTLLLEANAGGMNDLMREVVRSTIMVAYTDRFYRRSPIMRRLIIGNSELNAKKRAYYLLRLQEAENRLSKAQPETDEYYRAKGAVTRYQQAYTGKKNAEENQRRGRTIRVGDTELSETPKSLLDQLRSSGAFGDRMVQVLDRFKDEHGMRKDAKADSITLSFGNTRLMDGVKTSPLSKDSKFNIMWRQLEYGSGRHMKEAGNIVPKPNLPGSWIPKQQRHSKEYFDIDPQSGKKKRVALTDGSWMLGGMRIEGSHPGNWLRDQNGAAYTEDALLFYPVFFARLTQRLRGQG